MGVVNNKQREFEAARANDPTKRVEQVDTDRAGLPRWAEAFVSNPEPDDGTEREKRDLAAQETSAAWAFWIVLFAAIQTVLTVVGIYFVKRTLDATLATVADTSEATKVMREANRLTHRQMQRGLMKERPIVRVLEGASLRLLSAPWYGALNQEERERARFFSCSIQNTGKSACWVECVWVEFAHIVTKVGTTKTSQSVRFQAFANCPLEPGQTLETKDAIF